MRVLFFFNLNLDAVIARQIKHKNIVDIRNKEKINSENN
jgi:hypothetical protein